MGDTTSRVFALLGLVICVWVITFWLYEPRSGRAVIVDDRPPEDAPAIPAPVLPQPRSLPPVPPADPPVEFAAPPELPPSDPAPVAGPGEVLIPPEFTDYTVQRGDRSLQELALRFYGDRSRWVAIARANPFFTPDKLKPGITVLKIPKDPDNIQGKVVKVDPPVRPPASNPPAAAVPPAAVPAPDSGWRTYTVQENDTLWGIAKKMYNRPSLTGLIADANTDVLPDPDRLKPGITLKIPPAPPLD